MEAHAYPMQQAGPDPLADEEIRLLREIATTLRVNPPSLAITDESAPPILNTDYPVKGSSRHVVPRKPVGGLVEVPNISEFVSALIANSNRLGGTIVNRGPADVLLVLAPFQEASTVAQGPIFLTGDGGSWDFRLGPLLWCGSVSAIALLTKSGEEEFEASELAVVEV